MINVLILEDAPELQDRIAFLLESIPGIRLHTATSRNEAEAILLTTECPIDLMVIDYRHAPLSSLAEVQKAAKNIDCIFCVQDQKRELPPLGWNVFATLDRPAIPELLLKHMRRWRDLHADRFVSSEKNDYCRIKTGLLIDVSPLYSDIYVKLSESKYIKLFLEGDVFDQEDLRRYSKEKKIEYMYLRLEDCQGFIEKYVLFIKDLLKSSKPIALNDLAYMHSSVQESVQELTAKMGFTPEVQELVKAQIEITVKTMGRSPLLKNLLVKLEGQKGKYLADHSFLTGYIACAIAAQMQWSSDSTFTKLTLAAFMHDIVLPSELAHCETLAEAQALCPSAEALNEYTRHPYRVSEMIRTMPEIPADVDAIVFQHHERPNGDGFPRGITANHISPLSAIFMIAHDMAKAVIVEETRFSVENFLLGIQLKYPQSAFRKMLAAVDSLAL